MHRYRFVVWLIALCLAGCATPKLVATAAPPDSTLYVDGRRAGARGSAEVHLGYYGHVAVSAVANPAPERHHDFLEEQCLLPVPVPYSRWLFPVDFLLEAVSYPFWDPYHHDVNLALQQRVLLQPGVCDPAAEAIRVRARLAGLER